MLGRERILGRLNHRNDACEDEGGDCDSCDLPFLDACNHKVGSGSGYSVEDHERNPKKERSKDVRNRRMDHGLRDEAGDVIVAIVGNTSPLPRDTVEDFPEKGNKFK